MTALLEVRDLRLEFKTARGILTALNGISFDVRARGGVWPGGGDGLREDSDWVVYSASVAALGQDRERPHPVRWIKSAGAVLSLKWSRCAAGRSP